MEWKKEFKILFWTISVFVLAFFLPLENARFKDSVMAMLDLTKWYAQEHVILCLLPAFFIAGVIAVFVSQGAVMKYFGAKAKKWVAYTVASVSGTILAVCSCTILPLFSSIHKRGAGLGPAIAFLYSGPAINILAIILTARILGFEMGVARIIGAVVFAVVIGSAMSLIYRKEERVKREEQISFPDMPEKRPMWQTAFHFFTLVLILVFANWGKPGSDVTRGGWYWLWANKWYITSVFAGFLIFSLIFILKLKWQHVILAAVATAGSNSPSCLSPFPFPSGRPGSKDSLPAAFRISRQRRIAKQTGYAHREYNSENKLRRSRQDCHCAAAGRYGDQIAQIR